MDLPLSQTPAGSLRGARSIDVGPEPVQVAISPDSQTVFASVAGSRTVVRIDVADARRTGEVAMSAAPAQLWATTGGLVLSANQGTEEQPGSTVSIIDASTMEVIDEVATGSGPHGITVTPDEELAWVTNAFDDTVTVIDLGRAEVVATHPVGDNPNGITVAEAPRPQRETVELLMPEPYAPGSEEQSHDHGNAEPSASPHH